MLLFTSCLSQRLPAAFCAQSAVGITERRILYLARVNSNHVLMTPSTRLLVLFDVVIVSIWLLRCHRCHQRSLLLVGLRPAAAQQFALLPTG